MRSRSARLVRHALVTFGVATILSGCTTDGLDLARVQGKVTHEGKALTHGQVVFTPVGETRGPQAIGQIQEDGTFEMMTNDRKGASVGKHKVTVHCRAKLTEAQEKTLEVPRSLIPEKFGKDDETPFRFEVKRGANDCPLELK